MPDQKDAITILLAQFQALRAEIAGRSSAQTTMMQLTLTAFGALAGLAFTREGDERLLLLIPIISTILGLIWLDHAANISKIGNFIREDIMPALKQVSEMSVLPDYESKVLEYERSPGSALRMFGLPTFLVFILVPLAAVVMSCAKPHGAVFWVLFPIDIVLLVLFTQRWWPFLKSPRLRGKA